MGNNSIRQTVETMSAWRSDLKHIKKQRRRQMSEEEESKSVTI